MNLTKRDIVDIVLVGIAFWFLLQLLTSLATWGLYIGMKEGAETYMDKTVAVVFQSLHFLALLVLNYILLFRRRWILSLIVPDGSEKEVAIPAGLSVLASYGFWIRLLGIFILLSSSIRFLARLAMDLAAEPKFTVRPSWIFGSGTELVSAVLAAIVVWKADWIADKLGKLGSSRRACQPSSGSAPGAPPAGKEPARI